MPASQTRDRFAGYACPTMHACPRQQERARYGPAAHVSESTVVRMTAAQVSLPHRQRSCLCPHGQCGVCTRAQTPLSFCRHGQERFMPRSQLVFTLSPQSRQAAQIRPPRALLPESAVRRCCCRAVSGRGLSSLTGMPRNSLTPPIPL